MEIFHQKVMKFLLKKSSEISIFSCSEVPIHILRLFANLSSKILCLNNEFKIGNGISYQNNFQPHLPRLQKLPFCVVGYLIFSPQLDSTNNPSQLKPKEHQAR